MELKQRKRINNIPKFNSGTNLSSSVKGIGGDITGMGAYKQQLTSLPTIKEINGMKTPSTSLGGGGGVSADAVTGAVNGTIGIIHLNPCYDYENYHGRHYYVEYTLFLLTVE